LAIGAQEKTARAKLAHRDALIARLAGGGKSKAVSPIISPSKTAGSAPFVELLKGENKREQKRTNHENFACNQVGAAA
jgi:hypothetical protein